MDSVTDYTHLLNESNSSIADQIMSRIQNGGNHRSLDEMIDTMSFIKCVIDKVSTPSVQCRSALMKIESLVNDIKLENLLQMVGMEKSGIILEITRSILNKLIMYGKVPVERVLRFLEYFRFACLPVLTFRNILFKLGEIESVLVKNFANGDTYPVHLIGILKRCDTRTSELYTTQLNPTYLQYTEHGQNGPSLSVTNFQPYGNELSESYQMKKNDLASTVFTEEEKRRSPMMPLMCFTDNEFVDAVEIYFAEFSSSIVEINTLSLNDEYLTDIFTFLTSALDYVCMSNSYSDNRIIMKLRRILDTLPISILFSTFDQTLLKEHLENLYYFTKRITEKTTDNSFERAIIIKFRSSVIRLQIFESRINGNGSNFHTELLTVVPVFEAESNFEQSDDPLKADILSENSLILWKNKFQNFKTLQEAVNVHGDCCCICLEKFSSDVGILSACNHIMCLSCIESWFNRGSGADRFSCPQCRSVTEDYIKGSSFERIREEVMKK